MQIYKLLYRINEYTKIGQYLEPLTFIHLTKNYIFYIYNINTKKIIIFKKTVQPYKIFDELNWFLIGSIIKVLQT